MIDWLKTELRLMFADSWDDGRFMGPPDPLPCTSSHPACARLLERQADLYARMRRMKYHVLDRPAGHFTPAAGTDVRHTFARVAAANHKQVRRAA